MSEQPSNRAETEDVTRVDSILGLLGDLSKRDPSPVLRERLSALATERLSRNFHDVRRKPQKWLKPAIASACFVAIGLGTGLAVHHFEREPVKNSGTAQASPPAVSEEMKMHPLSPVRESVSKRSKVRRPRAALVETAGPRQMTMRLPYSNSAIDTGTGATIRVLMSQSELLSLGFPINATVQDRQIVAELTLGDDGLPRAISLPVPLEVMKEKK